MNRHAQPPGQAPLPGRGPDSRPSLRHTPARPRRSLLSPTMLASALLVLAGALAGCATIQPATPTPQPSDPIVNGGCVHTDGTPVGVVKDLWGVDCSDPDASYRVVGIVFTGLDCPQTAEYEVTRLAQTYCLSTDLTGLETPALDLSAEAGDCVHLDGVVLVDSMHKVPCDDATANYLVVAVRDAGAFSCPDETDTTVDVPMSFGLRRTYCLQTR